MTNELLINSQFKIKPVPFYVGSVPRTQFSQREWQKELGNGLSDIRRFSLPRITAEGTRRSRA
jgi:hypothetical protein